MPLLNGFRVEDVLKNILNLCCHSPEAHLIRRARTGGGIQEAYAKLNFVDPRRHWIPRHVDGFAP